MDSGAHKFTPLFFVFRVPKLPGHQKSIAFPSNVESTYPAFLPSTGYTLIGLPSINCKHHCCLKEMVGSIALTTSILLTEEIQTNHLGWCKNLVNHGINLQYQLVIPGFFSHQQKICICQVTFLRPLVTASICKAS